MSFGNVETTRRKGKPVTLYYFRYGVVETSFHAYTDAVGTITGPGSVEPEVDYAPVPIGRDAIRATGSLDKSILKIRMPQVLEVFDHFRLYPPPYVVTCVIRQGHLNDPDADFPTVWSGKVVSAKFDKAEGELSCEPVNASMRRQGLRSLWKIGCQRGLYQSGCNADRAAVTSVVTVDGVTSNLLTLPDNWFAPQDVTKYIGGLVDWTTPEGNVETRMVLRIVDGRDLLVNGLLRDLVAGGSVNIAPGCNHKQDDCLNLHLESGVGGPNIHNYGGFDWIPLKNPFGGNNNYY